jgi:hypothetical protein
LVVRVAELELELLEMSCLSEEEVKVLLGWGGVGWGVLSLSASVSLLLTLPPQRLTDFKFRSTSAL